MAQRRTSWKSVLAACLAAVPWAIGCSAVQGVREHIAYNDTVNDFALSWRNSAWASQAWHMRKWQFIDQPYFRDFGEGFRAGYIDVASGGNGCTPALPPRKYWTWRYQTAEGQAKVAAWFAGYPHGARAAEEDGAGLFSQIQVSELLRKEFQLGHQPPYKSPLYFHNPENWCPPDQMPGQQQPGTSDADRPTVEGQGPPLLSPPDKNLPPMGSSSPSLPPHSGAAGTGPNGSAAAVPVANRSSGAPGSVEQPQEDPYTLLPWVQVAKGPAPTDSLAPQQMP